MDDFISFLSLFFWWIIAASAFTSPFQISIYFMNIVIRWESKFNFHKLINQWKGSVYGRHWSCFKIPTTLCIVRSENSFYTANLKLFNAPEDVISKCVQQKEINFYMTIHHAWWKKCFGNQHNHKTFSCFTKFSIEKLILHTIFPHFDFSSLPHILNRRMKKGYLNRSTRNFIVMNNALWF